MGSPVFLGQIGVCCSKLPDHWVSAKVDIAASVEGVPLVVSGVSILLATSGVSESLVATGVLFGAGAGMRALPSGEGAGMGVLLSSPGPEDTGVGVLLGSPGASTGVGVVVAASGVPIAMVLCATWATGGGTPGSMCIIPSKAGSLAPSSGGQAHSLH
jgi:hypothetical protein